MFCNVLWCFAKRFVTFCNITASEHDRVGCGYFHQDPLPPMERTCFDHQCSLPSPLRSSRLEEPPCATPQQVEALSRLINPDVAEAQATWIVAARHHTAKYPGGGASKHQSSRRGGKVGWHWDLEESLAYEDLKDISIPDILPWDL